MYERFTDRARKVMQVASAEANRLGQSKVDLAEQLRETFRSVSREPSGFFTIPEFHKNKQMASADQHGPYYYRESIDGCEWEVGFATHAELISFIQAYNPKLLVPTADKPVEKTTHNE